MVKMIFQTTYFLELFEKLLKYVVHVVDYVQQ